MSSIIKGLTESRSNWDSNMPGYQGDYGGEQNWNSSKKEFKRREMEHELGHEDEQERREQSQYWYIRKDGKIIKDKAGQPYTFRGKAAANKAAVNMMNKDFNKGKKFVLTTSSTDALSITEGTEDSTGSTYMQVKTLIDKMDKGGKKRIADALRKQLGQPISESKEDDEADYGPEYQAMVKRVGQMAKEGPRKTVWDPEKRVYKTVPINPPKQQGVVEDSLEELANTSLKVKEPKNFVNVNDRKQVVYKVMKFKSGKDKYAINFTVQGAPAFGKKQNWNAVNVAFGVREDQDDYSFGDEINTDLTARNKNQFLIYSTVINAVRKFITEYNTEIDEIIMQGAGERQAVMYQRFFQSAGKYFPGWHYNGKHSLVRDVPRQKVKKVKEQGVAEGWSQKYKSSINCSHPKGFSQKAHCAGKKKHNESVEMEATCPDCGMCQTHSDHENLDEACWKGYHKEGNKKMFGKTYPNCVKNTNEDATDVGKSQPNILYLLRSWRNRVPAQYAWHLTKTFGDPHDATEDIAIWHDRDGFKRIEIKDEYVMHISPSPHYDYCYSYIDLRVPHRMSSALADCSESILIDHLKNEVGARCASLAANAVTLNFVMDVVAGRTRPSRDEYEQRIMDMHSDFENGKIFSIAWWPDQSHDTDPANTYYRKQQNSKAQAKSQSDMAEGKRIPRKAGQPANSKKHSDLYTDENPKGTITGLKFATAEDARASVSKIRNSGRSHAHKIQAAVAMEQRAKAAGKSEAASVYRKYINATKKTDEGIDLEEACWDTHKQVGMKNKGGKQVPNCVPKESVNQGVAEGLSEARNSLFAFVKQQFPTWPDYVLKDFLYTQAKDIRDQAELDDFLKRNKQDFGNCKWTLTKLPITFDIFTPETQRMLASREGGSSNPFQVPRDAERHAQQSQMIQQKGVSVEPIIVAKLSNGYDLIEGWHRTIQHLKAFPEGYTGPAWVCTGATYKTESVEQGVAEAQHSCPHCGGEMVSEELMNEKKDACYYKVKNRYKVWPSAYASGALVKCRNKGASNWGNGGKKNESSILEGINRADESLHDWFNKEKWVRMDTKGNIKGPCAKEPGEGKPKCLPQAKAHSLGKKGRASAAARKRREDPNPERSGKAINVNTKKSKG